MGKPLQPQLWARQAARAPGTAGSTRTARAQGRCLSPASLLSWGGPRVPTAWGCGLEHSPKGTRPFLLPPVPILYVFMGGGGPTVRPGPGHPGEHGSCRAPCWGNSSCVTAVRGPLPCTRGSCPGRDAEPSTAAAAKLPLLRQATAGRAPPSGDERELGAAPLGAPPEPGPRWPREAPPGEDSSCSPSDAHASTARSVGLAPAHAARRLRPRPSSCRPRPEARALLDSCRLGSSRAGVTDPRRHPHGPKGRCRAPWPLPWPLPTRVTL